MAIRKRIDRTSNGYIEEEKKENLALKSDVIDLENFYVNGQLDNLEQIVKAKKEQIVNKIIEYGNMQEGKETNQYLISTYFFKSINALGNCEPQYSSEKLAIVWNLYMYLVEQVNINIGMFQPTISHFCKFAGITTRTLKNLRNSSDFQMQTIVERIFDETFDSNVLMAQNKKLSNRSTELRVKVENEVQEKPQVKVNVNVNQELDLEQISDRFNDIMKFNVDKKETKRKEIIEVEADE